MMVFRILLCLSIYFSSQAMPKNMQLLVRKINQTQLSLVKKRFMNIECRSFSSSSFETGDSFKATPGGQEKFPNNLPYLVNRLGEYNTWQDIRMRLCSNVVCQRTKRCASETAYFAQHTKMRDENEARMKLTRTALAQLETIVSKCDQKCQQEELKKFIKQSNLVLHELAKHGFKGQKASWQGLLDARDALDQATLQKHRYILNAYLSAYASVKQLLEIRMIQAEVFQRQDCIKVS